MTTEPHCATCGTQPSTDRPAFTWSLAQRSPSTGQPDRSWTCAPCSRDELDLIETGLIDADLIETGLIDTGLTRRR